MLKRFLALSAWMLFFSACGESQSFSEPFYSSNVIYGEDNRLDIYEINNPLLLDYARSSVAIFRNRKLIKEGDTYKIKARPFKQVLGLCEGERFREQKIAADCSGALVGIDLVLTAGHCVRDTCSNKHYVFDYSFRIDNMNPYEVPAKNVYYCSKIIAREFLGGRDYAIVQLDRPVVNRKILPISKKANIAIGEQLFMIGYPSGLPAKFADGAYVRDISNENYFVTNTDSYSSNSGSPIFNKWTGEIEGVLASGEDDFEKPAGKQCQVSKRCAEEECRGEYVTRASVILAGLVPEK